MQLLTWIEIVTRVKSYSIIRVNNSISKYPWYFHRKKDHKKNVSMLRELSKGLGEHESEEYVLFGD